MRGPGTVPAAPAALETPPGGRGSSGRWSARSLDQRVDAVRGRGDRKGLRDLRRQGLLPPAPGSPRLLQRAVLGISLHGPPSAERSRPTLQAPSPAIGVQAPSLPGVGDVQTQLDMDLRLHPLHRLRDDSTDHRGPGLA